MAEGLTKKEWIGRTIFWRTYFVTLLFVSVNMVKWALAVIVGGYGIWDGFKDVFEYFSIEDYLFVSGLRLIPYVLLALAVRFIGKADAAKAGMAWLSLLTITGFHAWGYWMWQYNYYGGEHVSSTTSLDFIFMPFFAVYYGLIAGAIGWVLGYIYSRFIKPTFHQS